jgi:hypothetical protein
MFEKIKLIMLLVFTLCFLAYSVLVGKFYEKFNINRTAWIIICGVLTVVLVAVFIADLVSKKHDVDK